MSVNKEIGRELKVSELVPKTVVVVQPPGCSDRYFTLWVQDVNEKTVTFHAGELGISIINFVRPDGTVIDDRGRRVHVYEYLGEIDDEEHRPTV